MIQFKNKDYKKLIDRIYNEDQEQVFDWWDQLDNISRQKLLNQLKGVDFTLIKQLREQLKQFQREKSGAPVSMEPPEIISIPETEDQKRKAKEAEKTGEEVIRKGQVGAFLVAGGQGTRLGYDGPKGTFPITPVKGKTLFQLHAEKIRAAAKKYHTTIPWYIMTSETNDEATKQFFKRNNYFGFNKNDIFFLKQKMLPALDEKGRFILDKKDHIFESPNGHGGSLLALFESGALDDMDKRGVKHISYFQVDNVLTTIIDPIFLGYHVLQQAEMSSKMVRKKTPEEKVGVFGRVDDKLKVIEYSDMSNEDQHARDENGNLKYSGGNIALHIINVDFVREEVEDGFKLPYHIAHKKIPFLDDNGQTQVPDSPNGYKFETFVFDALQDTTSSVIMEVARDKEFSPVKNKKGLSSPETAKQDMTNFFGSWLEKAGNTVPRDENGDVKGFIEISPFYARNLEEFLQKKNEIEFKENVYIH
ncbi:MAG: UDPGP type 1 family protein [bacterium]